MIHRERRLYHVGAAPHDPSTRGAELVRAVTRVEQAEIGGWRKVAAERVPR